LNYNVSSTLTPLPVFNLENISVLHFYCTECMLCCGAGTGTQDNSGNSVMLWRPQYTYFAGLTVDCDCPSSCSRLCRFTGCETNFPEHRPNNSASRPVRLVSITESTKQPMLPAKQ